MRRLHTLVIVFLVVFAVGIGSVAAAPMTVTSSLPFVWLRSAPSSYAAAVYTLYPGYAATVETTGNTAWDGYQTWTEVYLIANSGIRGWVEQGSLVSASQPAAQNWNSNAQNWPNNAQNWNNNAQNWPNNAQNWNSQTQWGQPQYVAPYTGGWQQPYYAQGYRANPRLVPYYGQITYGDAGWQQPYHGYSGGMGWHGPQG